MSAQTHNHIQTNQKKSRVITLSDPHMTKLTHHPKHTHAYCQLSQFEIAIQRCEGLTSTLDTCVNIASWERAVDKFRKSHIVYERNYHIFIILYLILIITVSI